MDSSSENINTSGPGDNAGGPLPQVPFNWQSMLDGSSHPTYVLDTSLVILYLNKAAMQVLSFLHVADTSFTGMPFLKAVPEERQHVASVVLEKVLAGEEMRYETPYVLKSEGKTWFEMNYRPIADEAGRIQHIMVTAVDITEFKKNEAALSKREQRWKFIVEGDGNGVWETNLSTRENYYSPFYKSMLGFEEDDPGMIGFVWKERIHPEDLYKISNLQALYDKMIIEHHSVEYRIRLKNGDYAWMLNRGMVMEKFPDGRPLRLAGTQKDITLSKTAEEALRQSEDRYYQMIDCIEEYAIMMLDKNGVVLNWNKGAQKIKGYKSWEIIGKKFLVFYTQEDLDAGLPEALLNQALRTGKSTAEGWRIKKDGSRFWASVTMNLVKDRENRIMGFSKITRDLTEKKLAEDKLVKSEFQFSSFMHHTPTMNWIIDEHAVFRYLNDSYMKAFNLTPEAIGKSIYEIFPKEICHEFVTNNWKVWLTGQAIETFEEGISPEGVKQFYHIYKFPLPDENGVKLLGGVSLDLTQQRLLERELASEEDKRKRDIIQAIIEAQEKERKSIAYELHDNVNQILTSSRLMLEVAAEKPDSYTKFVNNSLLYLQSAIKEVRRISHSLTPGTLNDIGLEDAIDEIVTEINNGGNLVVDYKKRILRSTKELSPEIQLTILRIVQEQVKNILKHAHAEKATIILKSTQQRISVSVQDDGRGFDVSNTKKGLGLNGIFNRTEYFNGRVILESSPGNGCTLLIFIPVKPSVPLES